MSIAPWWCGIIWLRNTTSNRWGGSFVRLAIIDMSFIEDMSPDWFIGIPGWFMPDCPIPGIPWPGPWPIIWSIMATWSAMSIPYQSFAEPRIWTISFVWSSMMFFARSFNSWWLTLAP